MISVSLLFYIIQCQRLSLISFAKRNGINLIIVDNSAWRLLGEKENYIHNANLGGLAGAYNQINTCSKT